MSTDRIQNGITEVLAPLAPPKGLPSSETRVYCPRCYEPTESLKVFQIVKLLFVWFVPQYGVETIIACPSCMRRAIRKRVASSILLTNLLFPLVAIIYAYQYFATYTRGHSSKQVALAHLRDHDHRFGNVEQAITRPMSPNMFTVVVSIVIIMFFLLVACMAGTLLSNIF